MVWYQNKKTHSQMCNRTERRIYPNLSQQLMYEKGINTICWRKENLTNRTGKIWTAKE